MAYTAAKPKTDDVKINEITLSGMVKRRAAAAKAHWEKKYNLKKLREDNLKLANTTYIKDRVVDERYEQIFADNRLFVANRTLTSFLTTRMTQPEVIPSDDDPLALQFANDFEKILVAQADEMQTRQKVKLVVQDLLAGQRIGILKLCYNPNKNCIELEHLSPDSVVVDHTVKQYEEPTFVQITQKRTVAKLIEQFPDKKDDLFLKLNIQKGVPAQLEVEKEITENWIYIDNNGKQQLIVCWLYDDLVLGKTSDPNWLKVRKNLLQYPTMPFVFFNFLNDGTGLIDSDSFIEQAQYSQKNYESMGQRIVEDAQYGGIGVPVFGKDAIDQGEASKVKFSPVQRIILDTPDVNKGFTTWQSGQMPNFIPEEKIDSRNNIDNIYGTPNILRGEQSNNQTLGQDIIVRDQAEGRQSELIDAIDVGMSKFYQLEGQFIYRYYDEEKYYRLMGDDGKFEMLVISQEKIAQYADIGIRVKAGTNVPIDRAQRRATIIKLADRMPTLTLYRELGIEDPEETYKLYLLEQADPKAAIEDVDKQIFDRDAEEDLTMVIGGQLPEDRDDITEGYVNYLSEFLMTSKYEHLQQRDPQAAARVSEFIDMIIAKAKQKADKLATQVPIPMGTQLPPDQQSQDQLAQGAQPPNAPPQPPQSPAQPPQAPPMPPGQVQPPTGMPPVGAM